MHALIIEIEKSAPLITYIIFVFLVSMQRIWELKISKKNEKKLLSQGAVERVTNDLYFMIILHTLLPIACVAQAFSKKEPPHLWESLLWGTVFLSGQYLRWQARKNLGERWTVRIFVLPFCPPITHGPYRFIRHPNYLGVVLEIVSLPLIFGLYFTSFIFTLANAIILWFRIRSEEDALNKNGLYHKAFRELKEKD